MKLETTLLIFFIIAILVVGAASVFYKLPDHSLYFLALVILLAYLGVLNSRKHFK